MPLWLGFYLPLTDIRQFLDRYWTRQALDKTQIWCSFYMSPMSRGVVGPSSLGFVQSLSMYLICPDCVHELWEGNKSPCRMFKIPELLRFCLVQFMLKLCPKYASRKWEISKPTNRSMITQESTSYICPDNVQCLCILLTWAFEYGLCPDFV